MLTTLGLVFLCGIAVGSVLARSVLHSHLKSLENHTLAIEKARRVGTASLKARLNLTSAQEQTVNKILDDYGKFYQNIEDEREDVAEDGTRRILEVLTPEQRKAFAEALGVKVQ